MTTQAAPPPLADLELEKHILGAVLRCDLVVPCLALGVASRDFFRLAHRMIWDACVDLANRGTTANIVTVAECLRRRGQLTEVGPAYVMALPDGVPKPDDHSLRYLVGKLQGWTQVRDVAALLESATGSLRRAEDVGSRVADLIARLEGTQVRTARERRALDGWAQAEALLADLTRDPGEAITWKFPALDEQVPGIFPGEVFGLMARPSVGKTLMLTHLSRVVVPLGHVMFSLEMPAAQVARRIARSALGLNRHQLEDVARRGEFDVSGYVEATRGCHVIDTPGLSIAQMDGILRQLAQGVMRETPLRVVTIDHLGLIGGDRSLSTYDRVSSQAREIKELAKRHNVAIVLAIQVNREQGGDGSRELTLGAARDSGVVEEAVDYLLALRRLDYSRDLSDADRAKYREVVFTRLLKNRHGQLGPEMAIRLNGEDLTMAEDPYMRAEEAGVRDLLRRVRR